MQGLPQPPAWLKPIHSDSDLGHPNFFPPLSSAAEEQLTDKTVQHGYTHPAEVNAESFGGKGNVFSALRDGALEDVKQLLDLVTQRRVQTVASTEVQPFKPPNRNIRIEALRLAFFNDLTNPNTPMQSLKSVPGGLKGPELLEILQTRSVPLARAIWWIRVVGANENGGAKQKTNYDPQEYSIEWANAMIAYLRKLFIEVSLPSAPRVATVKQTFKSVLGDADTRQRWLAKMTYTLNLLRPTFSENMVDHATFLSWLSQQLASANLAQAGFVTAIVDEYLDPLLGHRVFAIPLIEGCLIKLKEIAASSVKDSLEFLAVMLRNILTRAFPLVPDAFVAPTIWLAHATALSELFGGEAAFADIQRRNDAILFRTLPARTLAEARATMAEIAQLNGIGMDTDLGTLRKPPLRLMLTWAASPTQNGIHRAPLVATLASTLPDVYDTVLRWLDEDDGVQHKLGAARLIGELERRGLFSYERFVQRVLVADEAERFRPLLADLPMWNGNEIVLRQRKVALHGIRARETDEDRSQRAMRAEVRHVLPNLFGGTLPVGEPPGRLRVRLPLLFGGNKFAQTRVVGVWLLQIFLERLRVGLLNDPTVALRTYSVMSELLVATHCFGPLCDVNVALLEASSSPAVLGAVIDNITRFAFLFKCMDAVHRFDEALSTARQSLLSQPAHLRTVQRLLRTLDRGQSPGLPTLALIDHDLQVAAQQHQPPLGPASPEDLPALDQEITQLAIDTTPNAPAILAHGLWTRYAAIVPGWIVTALESIFATLNQVAEESQSAGCVERFSIFLHEVDILSAGALDSQLGECLQGPIMDDLRQADQPMWDAVAQLLMQLILRGSLSTDTILRGVVYPAWRLAEEATDTEALSQHEAFLTTATLIARSLLVCQPDPEAAVGPRTLSEAQKLKAARAVMYDTESFSTTLNAIRGLAAAETLAADESTLKASATATRTALQTDREFCSMVNKHIDLSRDVFLGPSSAAPLLVQMLRALLGDSMSDIEEEPPSTIASSGLQNISAKVDPWTFSRMSINVHLTLQELAKGLLDDVTKVQTVRDIDTFTMGLFDNVAVAEETDLLADVLRGISGPVAGKFVNNGVRRLAGILEEINRRGSADAKKLLGDAGEVLRLLASAILPLRDDCAKLPALEPDAQDALVTAVAAHLESIRNELGTESPATLQETLQRLVLVVRALQYGFSLREPWSPRARGLMPAIMKNLAHLCSMCGGPSLSDHRTFVILIDTMALLLDDVPKDQPRAVGSDLFRHVPAVNAAQLTHNLSEATRKRLSFILPYKAKAPWADDLSWIPANAANNPDDSLQRPLVNRPWDWIEAGTRDQPSEHLVVGGANIPSLDFALFGVRYTHEVIVGETESAERGWRTDAPRSSDLLMQQDSFATGSLFESDWRSSRAGANGKRDTDDGELEDYGEEVDGPADGPHDPAALEQAFHESSPAPTVLSRTSAAGFASGSSLRGSPVVQGQRATDSSSVPRTSTKRKASTDAGSATAQQDDPQMQASSSKRGRGRGGSKTTSKTTRGRGKK